MYSRTGFLFSFNEGKRKVRSKGSTHAGGWGILCSDTDSSGLWRHKCRRKETPSGLASTKAVISRWRHPSSSKSLFTRKNGGSSLCYCLWCTSVCLHMCLCTMCMSGDQRGPKAASDPLEGELQMVVSCHISARNQTQVP